MAAPSDPYPWQEPVSKPARGAFVVIEGLDRAGKTTQVKRLCDKLYAQGHNIKTIRFPDRTSPIGTMISTYLTSHSQTATSMSDHSIHLLFSANRWESSSFITSTLSSGYTLICDRYTHSGIVYSAAKALPNLDLEWARAPDVGLPKPDVVVFLDLEPEEAEKRGGFGEERYEKRGFQGRVRELYLGLVGREEEGIRRVDAGKGVDEVGESIFEVVSPVVDAVEKGEIGELGVVGK